MNQNSTPTLIGGPIPDERLSLDRGNLTPGVVCLANEARFNASYFSEPLTSYATGWRDANNIEATLDFLAPPVQVGRRFEYKRADNGEAFYSESDDSRAIGADFKRVEFKGSTVYDKTFNKGLTIRVDMDQVDNMPNWREIFTARLLLRLLRNELRRAFILVNSLAGTAKTWDTTAGKDPDQDVLTEMLAAVDESGVRPNRVLYGDVAWNKRLVAHRAQASAGGYASAGLRPDELASFLGVDGVRVSRERYQTGPAGTKSKVSPDIALAFYAESDLTPEDPSHFKRFWTPVEGGGRYRIYEQQINAKLIDLTVEHFSNVLQTSTVGIRKLTIS